MNLHRLLLEREAASDPIRVGLIGAGKFGAMFLAQAARTPAMHVAGIADLSPPRARETLARIGWPEARFNAADLDTALAANSTWVTDDTEALIRHGAIDVVIDATGSPAAGMRHALLAIENGHHIVMVNVEADALAGPLLASRARAAGVVYSLAYGDQPALICEMVDWARAAGLEVIAAGKGTKYLPTYHASTPDTVWSHYGISPADAELGGLNAKMFNSFLDGTKSSIEMAAVANATGLKPPSDGLLFPACDVDDLPTILRPRSDGGTLPERGVVEVISSLTRDGDNVPRDLRWGVYAVFAAPDDYVKRCFNEYGLNTDSTGSFAAMYKPYHLIGLELGISVASVALRGEPTGAPDAWRADVAATAKRDIAAGEVLDGEGGHTVWGKLIPATQSLARGALPLGLAQACRVRRPLSAGTLLTWDDVEFSEQSGAIELRREMEREFRPD